MISSPSCSNVHVQGTLTLRSWGASCFWLCAIELCSAGLLRVLRHHLLFVPRGCLSTATACLCVHPERRLDVVVFLSQYLGTYRFCRFTKL